MIKKLLNVLHHEAKPIKFPQVNFTYTKPSGMSEEKCGDLPCFRAGSHTVSCWKFSVLGRIRFLFTGKMWLYMLTDGHPPTTLIVDSPFEGTQKSDKK